MKKYRVSLIKKRKVIITAEGSLELVRKVNESYPDEELEGFILLSEEG